MSVKATYVGFGTDDNEDFYGMFVEAMGLVGIAKSDCRQVHGTPSSEEKSHLEASDVILIGGGDPYKIWRLLEDTYVGEQIRWRYYNGAVIIGVGEGAMILGQKAWIKQSCEKEKEKEDYRVFKTFEMVPILVSPDFGRYRVELEKMLAEQPTGGRILGLPQLGAVIFNRDGTLEPAWSPATEIRRAYHESPETVHRAIFLPPPRNLGEIGSGMHDDEF
jgi:cyanophycinase-like exopeptidase